MYRPLSVGYVVTYTHGIAAAGGLDLKSGSFLHLDALLSISG